MEIKIFLEKLSSDNPTPGGGSASALTGALSASLVAMSAGISSKKGKQNQIEMGEIRKRAVAIQKRLFLAIDEDAKSYEKVIRAFRLPKKTERERLSRTRMIQKAFQGATSTPQRVCRYALQLLDDSKTLILKGYSNIRSDAGVAAYLADTAVKGGLLNIDINLVSITDKSFVKKMNLLMKKLEKRRNRLIVIVEKTLHQTHSI